MGMSDKEIQALHTAVESYMKTSASFTSVDISNTIKADHQLWVRCQTVARALPEMVKKISDELDVDYIVTTIQVETSGQNSRLVNAKLYHLDGSDPDEYTARKQKALSPDECGLSVDEKDDAAAPQGDQKSSLSSAFKFPKTS